MCARGVSASRPYLVITVVCTPYVASASAAAEPAGPLPTTRTSVSRSGIGCPLLVARITSGGQSVAPTTERLPARSDRLRCTKCASSTRRTQGSRTATHGTGGGVEVCSHDPGQVLLVREAGPDGDLGDGRGIGAQ